MRLVPVVSVLALACSDPADDEPGALHPVDVVRRSFEELERVDERSRREAEIDRLSEELRRQQVADATTTGQRAELRPGWNAVKISAGRTSFWGIWAEGDDVLAVGSWGWIARSTDGGASWKRIATPALVGKDGKPPTLSAVYGHGDRRVVIAFQDPTVGVSADRGETWKQLVLTPPPGPDGTARSDHPRGLFGAGSTVYIATEGDLTGDTYGIFVSRDAGATWTPTLTLPQGDDDRRGFRGVTGTRDGREVYAYGTDARGAALYRSRDRGATWQRVPAPPKTTHIASAAVGDDGTVYLTFGDSDARHAKVARSRDGGRSWEPIAVPYLASPEPVLDEDWTPAELAIAPDGTLHVYLSAYAHTTGPETTSRLVSTRDGRTWTLERVDLAESFAFTPRALFAVGLDNRVQIFRR